MPKAGSLLCDALTYAERFDPACVIDVATLTGACAIALGPHAQRAVRQRRRPCRRSPDERRTRATTGAGGCRLWDDYLDQNASTFADTSSLGGLSAGAITAACFLGRFAKAYKWAHLDIAGTASTSRCETGCDRPSRPAADRLPREASRRSLTRRSASQTRSGGTARFQLYQADQRSIDMSDLVFIAFPTEAKAEEVRQKVLSLQKDYLIELGDAVVVVKDDRRARSS